MFGNFNSNFIFKNSNSQSIQEFEISGEKYKYDGSNNMKAEINWNLSGFYLGGGFDLGLFYGFKIFFDLGALLVNNPALLDLNIPTIGLKHFNVGTNSWDPVNTPLLIEELNNSKNKTIRETNESLDKIKLFPFVKIGLMYRF